MGLTVSQIIERAYEDILEAGGVARPAWDKLSTAITDAAATTCTLAGRQSNVPPDGTLEFDDSSMEIADIYSVAAPLVTFQERGYLGSTAATHLINTRVFLDNPYPKYILVNALKAVVGQLWGQSLYAKDYISTLTLDVTAPVVLPAGAVDVLEIACQNGSNWFPLVKNTNYRIFYNWTGVDTAPAVQFLGGGTQSAALKVWYKKDFTLSTFELTTDLETTVGISPTLTPHLATGLAGHVLQGRDVPGLEAEHIKPDPQNPVPPGTRMNVGRALWSSFLSGPVYAERVRNQQAFPTTTTYERV